jgi:hypothetical protein
VCLLLLLSLGLGLSFFPLTLFLLALAAFSFLAFSLLPGDTLLDLLDASSLLALEFLLCDLLALLELGLALFLDGLDECLVGRYQS